MCVLFLLVTVVVRSPSHHLYIPQSHRGFGCLWMDEGRQRDDRRDGESYRRKEAKGILHAHQRRVHGGLLVVVYVRGGEQWSESPIGYDAARARGGAQVKLLRMAELGPAPPPIGYHVQGLDVHDIFFGCVLG